MNDYTHDGFGDFGADPNGKYHVESAEETAARRSRRQLEDMVVDLQGRDTAILQALNDGRFMTTGQVSQMHFEHDHANPRAAHRAANRAMQRLQNHGFISPLERRIGGVKGGSSNYIWSLTTPGARAVSFDGEEPKRRRQYEPSARFVKHTLGISELNIQLLGIDGIAVMEAQFEPNCWRNYNGKTLKPDLYVVTSDGVYEDSWFFEIDLATEAPSRVVSKCEQYQDYFRAGIEQSDNGVFPAVVWVVPDQSRKASLQNNIAQSAALTQKELFMVIMPDELHDLIRRGAGL
jgi:hypothetical protein